MIKKEIIKLSKKHPVILVVVLLIFVSLAIAFIANYNELQRNYNDKILEGPYRVVRVVDGDTIIIDIAGDRERVRLIGIDAPESVHPDASKNTEEGVISSEYVKALLYGSYIYVEYDVELKDRYERTLAYIWIDPENMLNLHLVEIGYARVSTYPPNVKYEKLFLEAQREASSKNMGFWGAWK